MANNTGNAVPSRDPRDLLDNAESFDIRTTSRTQRSTPDRLGVMRKTWYGLEMDFADFLASSGFELPAATYIDDQALTIDRPTQLIERAGDLYSVSPEIAFPATLSGIWATDEQMLVVRSDQALRSELWRESGASMVRHGGQTVGEHIDQAALESGEQSRIIDEQRQDIELLDLRTSQVEARNAYQQLDVTGGSVDIDAREAGYFGVDVNEAITSLNISGQQAGKSTSIKVAFTQGPFAGKGVAAPGNVLLPRGTDEIVSHQPADVTLARFTNLGDGSPNWMYERIGVYPADVSGLLPPILTENALFNDEGESTDGWATVGASVTTAGSYLRATRTAAAGAPSYIHRTSPATPPTNTDFIFYGKARAKLHLNSAVAIRLGQANGGQAYDIWLGAAATDAAHSPGTIAVSGVDGNHVVVASGVNYETSAIEFALHYDAKFNTLNCWFREADGRWRFSGRLQTYWALAPTVMVLSTTYSAVGTWVEVDYLTLARPNIALLSDSIGAGETLYNPNPANGVANDESTWMRHAALYPGLRNNLVVNKGVGGNTTAQMLARVTDVTSTGAKVVFLHASTNDYWQSVAQATRTGQTQSIIDAIVAAGAQAVLLNAVYGTEALASNPGMKLYCAEWWEAHAETLSGVACAIDIMSPLSSANHYIDAALCQADGVHPNINGYTEIGRYIARFR